MGFDWVMARRPGLCRGDAMGVVCHGCSIGVVGDEMGDMEAMIYQLTAFRNEKVDRDGDYLNSSEIIREDYETRDAVLERLIDLELYRRGTQESAWEAHEVRVVTEAEQIASGELTLDLLHDANEQVQVRWTAELQRREEAKAAQYQHEAEQRTAACEARDQRDYKRLKLKFEGNTTEAK